MGETPHQMPEQAAPKEAPENIKQVDARKMERLRSSWEKNRGKLQGLAAERSQLESDLDAAEDSDKEKIAGKIEKNRAAAEAVITAMEQMISDEGKFGERADSLHERAEGLSSEKERQDAIKKNEQERSVLSTAMDALRTQTIPAASAEKDAAEAAFHDAVLGNGDTNDEKLKAFEAAQDKLETLEGTLSDHKRNLTKLDEELDKLQKVKLHDTVDHWHETIQYFSSDLNSLQGYANQVWNLKYDVTEAPDAPDVNPDAPAVDAAIDDAASDGTESDETTTEYSEALSVHEVFDNMATSLLTQLIAEPPKVNTVYSSTGAFMPKGRLFLFHLMMMGADTEAVKSNFSDEQLRDAKTYLGLSFVEKTNKKGETYLGMEMGEPNKEALIAFYAGEDAPEDPNESISLNPMAESYLEGLLGKPEELAKLIKDINATPDMTFVDFVKEVSAQDTYKDNPELQQLVTFGEILGGNEDAVIEATLLGADFDAQKQFLIDAKIFTEADFADDATVLTTEQLKTVKTKVAERFEVNPFKQTLGDVFVTLGQNEGHKTNLDTVFGELSNESTWDDVVGQLSGDE